LNKAISRKPEAYVPAGWVLPGGYSQAGGLRSCRVKFLPGGYWRVGRGLTS